MNASEMKAVRAQVRELGTKARTARLFAGEEMAKAAYAFTDDDETRGLYHISVATRLTRRAAEHMKAADALRASLEA